MSDYGSFIYSAQDTRTSTEWIRPTMARVLDIPIVPNRHVMAFDLNRCATRYISVDNLESALEDFKNKYGFNMSSSLSNDKQATATEDNDGEAPNGDIDPSLSGIKDNGQIVSSYAMISKNHKMGLVYYSNNYSNEVNIACYYVSKTEAVKQAMAEFSDIIKNIHIMSEKPSAGKICFICDSGNGLYLREFKIKSRELDDKMLADNYNDDFIEVDKAIQYAISNDPKAPTTGIILLHGKHGTGKTSYIRHLISNTNKRVIYVPPNMATSVSSPSFLSFLLEQKKSILIIEDAENIIKTREAGENVAVSNLLNITDGILGDGLEFHVVCTFNTSINDIDPALMRKGRMVAQYEFTNLDEDKTRKLVKKVHGENAIPAHKTMSLAEIYGMNDDNFEVVKEERIFGFG